MLSAQSIYNNSSSLTSMLTLKPGLASNSFKEESGGGLGGSCRGGGGGGKVVPISNYPIRIHAD